MTTCRSDRHPAPVHDAVRTDPGSRFLSTCASAPDQMSGILADRELPSQRDNPRRLHRGIPIYQIAGANTGEAVLILLLLPRSRPVALWPGAVVGSGQHPNDRSRARSIAVEADAGAADRAGPAALRDGVDGHFPDFGGTLEYTRGFGRPFGSR